MKSLDSFLKNIDVNRLKAAFFMLLGIVVIGGFALFINTYLYKSRASEDKVNIVISPKVATWPTGQSYNVNVRLDPNAVDKKISGFDLSFKTSAPLTLVSIGEPVALGSPTVVFTKVVKTQTRVAYVIQGDTLATSVNIPFTFRADQAGTGTFSFSPTLSKVIGNIPNYTYALQGIDQGSYNFGVGLPTPTTGPTDGPVPTVRPGSSAPQSGTVSVGTMLLKFQGITSVVSQQMIVKLVAVSGTGLRSETEAPFASGDGGVWTAHNVQFPNIIAGKKYYILVKGPKSIQKKVCVVNPTETAVGSYSCGKGEIDMAPKMTLDFSGIHIMSGDLPPQDRQVDSYDLSYILNSLGSTAEEVTAIGDVNMNGRVDTQDYSLLIQSLTIKSDEK